MKIIKIELNGIKSISKLISINFTNKILDINSIDKSYIKGIYGPNGAGKTGIVTAIALYKSLITYKNSINEPMIKTTLINLINKKNNELFISIYFVDTNKDTKIINRYKHQIIIKLINKEPYIYEEKYSKLNPRLEEKVLFSTKKGEIVITDNSILDKACINLIDKSSVSSILLSLLKSENIPNESFRLVSEPIFKTIMLSANISVCFGNRDDSLPNIFQNVINDNIRNENIYKILATIFEGRGFSFDGKEFIVRKEASNNFVKYINKMTNFIKIIREHLIKITPKKLSEDKTSYKYKLTFVYKDYSSDLMYESTGVKKLVDIYDTLSFSSNGGIGIIDEIDAGIHDIVINKIIEYFVKESKSQLIFTTHNISLMNYLNKEDHSIDFLSTDSVLTKWIKNGTSSPEKSYINGYIPHIPFNIDYLDFKGKF